VSEHTLHFGDWCKLTAATEHAPVLAALLGRRVLHFAPAAAVALLIAAAVVLFTG
jgi:hypothetical protein